VFTHVSTCYTNCEKRGYIQEKVYDIDEDSESLVKEIMQMSPQTQDENLHQILGRWPNTYTFTKSMAERTLKKRRMDSLPMVLLRPSIIIGSYREPM
jgi:nucleoside-diphosphate-sugar epimerase